MGDSNVPAPSDMLLLTGILRNNCYSIMIYRRHYNVPLMYVIHDLTHSNSLLPALSIVDHKTTSWLSTENWTLPCGQLVSHTRPSWRKLWKSARTWATGRQWWQSWPAIEWPAGTAGRSTALRWKAMLCPWFYTPGRPPSQLWNTNRSNRSNLGATWTWTSIHSLTHLTPASPTELTVLLPHCMKWRRGLAMRILSVRPSDRPSLCQTRGLWQSAIKICPDFYTIRKII